MSHSYPNKPYIATRASKSAALTHDEMDFNLASLVHKITTSSDGSQVTFSYAPIKEGGTTIKQNDDVVVNVLPDADYIVKKVKGETLQLGRVYVQGVGTYNGTNPISGTNDLASVLTKLAGDQTTVTIVKDALTNLNGRELSSYTAVEGTVEIGEKEYRIYTIKYGAATVTEVQARDYMEYMTGFRFLPEYNYEKPKNSLFIFEDFSIWKPQYDSTNGLRLFYVSSLQDFLNQVSPFISGEGTGTNSVQQKGTGAAASGISSVAEGYLTKAEGAASHAEGDTTVASGDYSHAEGWYTTASGEASHAEGYHTLARETYDHAEGCGTQAIGGTSHAEGTGTVASANDSHAEGNATTASGEASHAEGYGTIASFTYAHAEGSGSVASGFAAHAEGNSIASQPLSHTEGLGTVVKNTAEHAEGSYNESHTSIQGEGQTLHSIGIGNVSQRRNAFEVMKSGDAYFYGLGGYDGTNPTSSLSVQQCVSPLIVRGVYSLIEQAEEVVDGTATETNSNFIPDHGAPTPQEAIAAFKAGRPVLFIAAENEATSGVLYYVYASYLITNPIESRLYAVMSGGEQIEYAYEETIS